uniref:Uncharacterized protein n=1 Tax=Crocodylus porosus TaxID=8502 RepID=A0A7M4DXA8_CROPO
ISGSKSKRGAALFNSPTSSSNTEANTDEEKYKTRIGDTNTPLTGICWISSSTSPSVVTTILLCGPDTEGTSSEGPEASFRCCK